ncbi:MAG TPA: hypothetical protein VMT02_08265 [Burkholderiales bacterium]|jgi:hypothetical protein|nr:hypothetical protein [Burkholderiales bacterium]
MLISEQYRELQRTLHERPGYGVASLLYAPHVAEALERAGADELLDYGSGKGRLGPALEKILGRPLTVHQYDPAIPEFAAAPQPCQFVACIDVLEHIEPELLGNVLDDLRRVTAGVGVFTVHCGAAVRILPDGRNAHLTQQPIQWWGAQLRARFDLLQTRPLPEGACFFVARKSPWWARLLLRIARRKV